MLVMNGIGILYHTLVMTQIVDYRNAWGGRLTSLEQMYQFESVSILIQIVFTTLIVIYYNKKLSLTIKKVFKGVFFFMSVLFILNTLGNIFAVELFERILFTPMTFLSAVFVFRMAIE
jgi:hypothetical protein